MEGEKHPLEQLRGQNPQTHFIPHDHLHTQQDISEITDHLNMLLDLKKKKELYCLYLSKL